MRLSERPPLFYSSFGFLPVLVTTFSILSLFFLGNFFSNPSTLLSLPAAWKVDRNSLTSLPPLVALHNLNPLNSLTSVDKLHRTTLLSSLSASESLKNPNKLVQDLQTTDPLSSLPSSESLQEHTTISDADFGNQTEELERSSLSNDSRFSNLSSFDNPLSHVRRVRTKLERKELSLAQARIYIKEAARIRNLTSIHTDPDYVPRGPIYRNPNAFHRSFLEMEKLFKIYVYKEGNFPLFHDGPCKNIYSSEGRFVHQLEKGKLYTTHDPDEAHAYFLPFSVVRLVQYLYEPGNYKIEAVGRVVGDYINLISNRYPFWNQSGGADHVMVSCHDWGPLTSSFVPQLYQNSIRVFCNANKSEGFNPAKDATLPEINLKYGEVTMLKGLSPSKRDILGFFAGGLHGRIRELLLAEWKDKDEELQVYNNLPKGVSYESMLRRSRFCLCPSGYEVASPRIVEALYAECVPVLISESYVPPFSDVLNWESFSVQVEVKDIARIKDILKGISSRQYIRMQRRVKNVQRHFVLNGSPKRYDVFHMIVHSIWLRRLNIQSIEKLS